jgi:lipid-A-disaccharide synthase
MVRVKYVNMINLLLDRPVVPELLQGRCRGDLLAAEVGRLLADEAARRAQRDAVSAAVQMLRAPNLTPSACAADTVLRVIAETRETRRANVLDAGRQPDGEP